MLEFLFGKKKKQNKKGTWTDGIGSLALAALLALTIRWLLIEAYVIPSGSMLPSLLIQDHIFVNKLIYGVRVPFSREWMLKFRNPQKGEVIVFRYPEDPQTFFIKRVVGVPGDKISWDGQQLSINGEKMPTSEDSNKEKVLDMLKERELTGGRLNYDVLKENLASHPHNILVKKDGVHATIENHEIPPDSLFVMGDNRDNSNDSRYWGYVPMDYILGRAMFVWLSCDETLPGPLSIVCNPLTIRWKRFFHNVQ